MQRNTEDLQQDQFDLLVIGAGAHGIFTALDASLRGLSVALIDRADLCGETSSNSLRTLHGGIRYLQYLQLGRTIESIREQAILRKIAPGLTQILPFVMPCSGQGMRGPAVMFAGMQGHQALRLATTLDVNGLSHLPMNRVSGASTYGELAPGVVAPNLTGTAIWNEVQLLDTNALLIGCAQAAEKAGATIANYVQADRLRIDTGKILGATCTDRLTGTTFDINAKTCINTTGPWIESFLQTAGGNEIKPMPIALNDSMNIVLRRQLFADRAIALPSQKKVEGKAVADANRMYFAVPWRGRSVIGTVQEPWTDEQSSQNNRSGFLDQLLEELNDTMPDARLERADIQHLYWGRVPTEDALDENGVKRRKADEVIDHGERDNIEGLYSLVGVKLTTARAIAKKIVDTMMRQSNSAFVRSSTHKVRLPLPEQNPKQPSHSQLNSERRFKERVRQSCENEMTMTASDFLYRRTDLAVLDAPTEQHCLWLASALPSHAAYPTMDLKMDPKMHPNADTVSAD